MDEFLNITLQIAERSYTVRIKREDEDIFRKASSMIKQDIQKYATTKSYRDKQDLLSMTLLTYVISHIRNVEKEKAYDENTTNKLNEINDFLTETLS
jgi:hypothetical protein